MLNNNNPSNSSQGDNDEIYENNQGYNNVITTGSKAFETEYESKEEYEHCSRFNLKVGQKLKFLEDYVKMLNSYPDNYFFSFKKGNKILLMEFLNKPKCDKNNEPYLYDLRMLYYSDRKNYDSDSESNSEFSSDSESYDDTYTYGWFYYLNIKMKGSCEFVTHESDDLLYIADEYISIFFNNIFRY